MGSEMYLLKVKGNGADADFLQIRDANFSLIANVRFVLQLQSLSRIIEDEKIVVKIKSMAEMLPHGKLTKIEV
jgi:hypothetical protein